MILLATPVACLSLARDFANRAQISSRLPLAGSFVFAPAAVWIHPSSERERGLDTSPGDDERARGVGGQPSGASALRSSSVWL
eukprot:8977343-Pyramimonas_sp.AAC.1